MNTHAPAAPAPAAAYLCPPGQAETRWMGHTCTRFLADGDRTDGAYCLVDETARQGEAVPLHRHPDDRESFYLIAGEITFYLNGLPGVRAGSGSFVHVPGGAVHGFRVESDSARYLILTTPRHGEFYRAISIPAQQDGRPATHEVDWDRIMALTADYGIEFIGPLPDP